MNSRYKTSFYCMFLSLFFSFLSLTFKIDEIEIWPPFPFLPSLSLFSHYFLFITFFLLSCPSLSLSFHFLLFLSSPSHPLPCLSVILPFFSFISLLLIPPLYPSSSYHLFSLLFLHLPILLSLISLPLHPSYFPSHIVPKHNILPLPLPLPLIHPTRSSVKKKKKSKTVLYDTIERLDVTWIKVNSLQYSAVILCQ